ncbi:hypothetical protein LJC34_00570 [Oscillospiraceae bacterium OttesenSCG-928-G22]|nr:hypothetical protein [Oscillospiraceae bacterium OttesenSCG-928-G22]
MQKKISAVIIIETILLLITAGVFFASTVFGVDIPSLFGLASASEPADGDNDWPEFSVVTPEPQADGEELRERPTIRAEVIVDGAHVRVNEWISLRESTTYFHGYLFAANYADTQVRLVSADGGIEKFSADNLNLYVNMREPSTEVRVEYDFYLPGDNRIMSISGNLVKLTNFLITPAVYRDGAVIEVYTAPFGDPFIYEAYDYEITLSASAEYDIHAPGKTEESTASDRKTADFSAACMRDFPVVLSKNVPVVTRDTPSGVHVTYIGAEESGPFVAHSMEWAAETIGEYPYEELFVVKTPMADNSGMEFSAMIFLNTSVFSDMETLKQLAYHEVLHQWFYCVIGVDQFNEPFLDEGLVTYLSGYLVNRNFQGYSDSGFLGMSLADYSTKNHYTRLAYNNAAAWLAGLHRDTGDRFFEILREIYAAKKYDILYYDEFISYFPAS